MIETIVGGLVVALVSGLTFVAYKHPRGFRKLYVRINIAVTVFWLGAGTYYFGYVQGFTYANARVYELNRGSGSFPNTATLDMLPWWIFVLPLAIYGYLEFLRNLPSVFNLDPDK
jgi:hypothetical protein